MTLDREQLRRLGIRVVEPTAEDEETVTVIFVPKKAAEAVKASLNSGKGDRKS